MIKGNNKFKDQTVIGIITCNRQELFKQCISSIDRNVVDKIIVVVAGEDYKTYPDDVKVIRCRNKSMPVGAAKNILIREMRKNKNHKFQFVVEDDIKILSNDVFQVYIETALESGLGYGQLSFGLCGGIGGGNINSDGTAAKIATVDYATRKVDFYRNPCAAFTLFFSDTWENLSGFNENYINAGEHIHLRKQLFTNEFGLPVKICADIFDSFEYLEDISGDSNNIRNSKTFEKNFVNAWKFYKKCWSIMPHEEPEVDINKIMPYLQALEDRFGVKI